jgi:hypothetical protein
MQVEKQTEVNGPHPAHAIPQAPQQASDPIPH